MGSSNSTEVKKNPDIIQGLTRPRGSKGDIGPRGYTGPRGFTGEMGPMGFLFN